MTVKSALLRIALATALLGTVAGSSVAAVGIKAGTLVCDVEGGVGRLITSKKNMGCTYTAVDGHTERYSGAIRKFGLDIGVTGNAKMVWIVFAPGKIDPDALRGKYIGAVADASLGLGAGVEVLIGGFDKSISLQPISVQGQTGLNLAVGVGALTLG